MFNPHLTFLANTKRNVPNDIIHDLLNHGLDFGPMRIRQNGKVTAGDIESDAAKRNLILVGDDSPDRLGVALVSVSAQYPALPTGSNASLDLLDGGFVALLENLRSVGQN